MVHCAMSVSLFSLCSFYHFISDIHLVKRRLESVTSNRVFVKDLSYCSDDQIPHIPNGFRHTFLIRNPLRVMYSYRKGIFYLLRERGKLTSDDEGTFDLEKDNPYCPKGFFVKELYDIGSTFRRTSMRNQSWSTVTISLPSPPKWYQPTARLWGCRTTRNSWSGPARGHWTFWKLGRPRQLICLWESATSTQPRWGAANSTPRVRCRVEISWHLTSSDAQIRLWSTTKRCIKQQCK